MPHPMARLRVGVRVKKFNFHLFYDMPQVVKKIAGSASIQLEFGINDAFARPSMLVNGMTDADGGCRKSRAPGLTSRLI